MGGNESTAVTAGLAGFVVLFALAVACIFLFRSMNSHLRKVRWREEREERQRSEAAEAAAGPDDQAGPVDGGATPQD
ncbi:hypothetical protein [Leekyejoonella antrihumi]|uniref:Uncharacterized protein n=1 Tax=Leekyejoonella antrihumi TaxID=1660198 RepID=A0A563E0X8_9MICO|nr:hypothetical protein [Leekyejoonella antrihumi]TWP36198.1 hypothetical protein FGL98_10895 [Leekyejoonella antrihumi]